MAILFISSLENNIGQSSSGGNVVQGISESLCKFMAEDVEFACHPFVPSFPEGPLWMRGYVTSLQTGNRVTVFATLNLKIVKTIIWGRIVRGIIKDWARRHCGEELNVLVYNTYHPSILDIYSACHRVGARLFAILFDLGVPPKRLGLSHVTMAGYEFAERIARKYIPLLDGRIVINELIVAHYAPQKDYLLIDGGVNNSVISHLFPIKEGVGDCYTFVLAGMLWDQNGTKLVLDAMNEYSNPNVRIVFAGDGIDVPIIEGAAQKDSRIRYVGVLNMKDLFALYESADVLMNLRLEEEIDFHFPGKLLEYLSTGRFVISTPVAHAERDYGEYMTVLRDRTPRGLINLMEEIQRKGKKNLFETGVRARHFILENRTWDKQTQRILEYMRCCPKV